MDNKPCIQTLIFRQKQFGDEIDLGENDPLKKIGAKLILEKYCLLGMGLPIDISVGGHGDRVVTLSPPTSEAGVRSPARPQVGKLVVACRWSAVYSTEP